MSSLSSAPPPLYIGGFHHSAEVLCAAIDRFGIQKPTRTYYPGSSTDASFCGIEGVDVVHADIDMSDQAIEAYASLGVLAVQADVHEYNPEGVFDVIVFINASGIDKYRVIECTNLRRGGLVISAMWGQQPPIELIEVTQLQLVGVDDTSQEPPEIIIDNLADFTQKVRFDELDTGSQQAVYSEYRDYLSRYGKDTPHNLEGFLDAMKNPMSRTYRDVTSGLPYKKVSSFYLF